MKPIVLVVAIISVVISAEEDSQEHVEQSGRIEGEPLDDLIQEESRNDEVIRVVDGFPITQQYHHQQKVNSAQHPNAVSGSQHQHQLSSAPGSQLSHNGNVASSVHNQQLNSPSSSQQVNYGNVGTYHQQLNSGPQQLHNGNHPSNAHGQQLKSLSSPQQLSFGSTISHSQHNVGHVTTSPQYLNSGSSSQEYRDDEMKGFSSVVVHKNDGSSASSGGLTVQEPPKGWPFSEININFPAKRKEIKFHKHSQDSNAPRGQDHKRDYLNTLSSGLRIIVPQQNGQNTQNHDNRIQHTHQKSDSNKKQEENGQIFGQKELAKGSSGDNVERTPKSRLDFGVPTVNLGYSIGFEPQPNLIAQSNPVFQLATIIPSDGQFSFNKNNNVGDVITGKPLGPNTQVYSSSDINSQVVGNGPSNSDNPYKETGHFNNNVQSYNSGQTQTSSHFQNNNAQFNNIVQVNNTQFKNNDQIQNSGQLQAVGVPASNAHAFNNGQIAENGLLNKNVPYYHNTASNSNFQSNNKVHNHNNNNNNNAQANSNSQRINSIKVCQNNKNGRYNNENNGRFNNGKHVHTSDSHRSHLRNNGNAHSDNNGRYVNAKNGRFPNANAQNSANNNANKNNGNIQSQINNGNTDNGVSHSPSGSQQLNFVQSNSEVSENKPVSSNHFHQSFAVHSKPISFGGSNSNGSPSSWQSLGSGVEISSSPGITLKQSGTVVNEIQGNGNVASNSVVSQSAQGTQNGINPDQAIFFLNNFGQTYGNPQGKPTTFDHANALGHSASFSYTDAMVGQEPNSGGHDNQGHGGGHVTQDIITLGRGAGNSFHQEHPSHGINTLQSQQNGNPILGVQIQQQSFDQNSILNHVGPTNRPIAFSGGQTGNSGLVHTVGGNGIINQGGLPLFHFNDGINHSPYLFNQGLVNLRELTQGQGLSLGHQTGNTPSIFIPFSGIQGLNGGLTGNQGFLEGHGGQINAFNGNLVSNGEKSTSGGGHSESADIHSSAPANHYGSQVSSNSNIAGQFGSGVGHSGSHGSIEADTGISVDAHGNQVVNQGVNTEFPVLQLLHQAGQLPLGIFDVQGGGRQLSNHGGNIQGGHPVSVGLTPAFRGHPVSYVGPQGILHGSYDQGASLNSGLIGGHSFGGLNLNHLSAGSNKLLLSHNGFLRSHQGRILNNVKNGVKSNGNQQHSPHFTANQGSLSSPSSNHETFKVNNRTPYLLKEVSNLKKQIVKQNQVVNNSGKYMAKSQPIVSSQVSNLNNQNTAGNTGMSNNLGSGNNLDSNTKFNNNNAPVINNQGSNHEQSEQNIAGNSQQNAQSLNQQTLAFHYSNDPLEQYASGTQKNSQVVPIQQTNQQSPYKTNVENHQDILRQQQQIIGYNNKLSMELFKPVHEPNVESVDYNIAMSQNPIVGLSNFNFANNVAQNNVRADIKRNINLKDTKHPRNK